MALALQPALGQLGDPSSSKRRAAAKRLRALRDPAAGPTLLTRLQAEVMDPRTWETQYQMIMAIGACNYAPAVEFLSELADQQTEHTMVGTAIGDALTRIDWATAQTLVAVSTFISRAATGDEAGRSLSDGAFRAIAILQLVPEDKIQEQLIHFASSLGPDDALRFWIVVAAAGWTGPLVHEFLLACSASDSSEIATAAADSLAGHYGHHSPL